MFRSQGPENLTYLVTVENNQQNALTFILLYFSILRCLLHVSAKQCHPQAATMFLSEPLQRQYVRSKHLTPKYINIKIDGQN
jgi:hypothetical protein